jgi:Beta-propeller repeat
MRASTRACLVVLVGPILAVSCGARTSLSVRGASVAGASSSTSTSTSSGGGPVCAPTWSQGFTSSGDVSVDAVAASAASHVVVAGSFAGTASFAGTTVVQQSAARDIFVADFDCAGNLVWIKTFGVLTTASEGVELLGLAVTLDGSILMIGDFQGTIDFGTGTLTSAGTDDGFIARLDAAGNGVFSRRFGAAAGSSYGQALAVDAEGDVYVTGAAYGPQDFGGGVIGDAGQSNLFVLELDPAGNLRWSKTFGRPGQPRLRLALDPANDVIVMGTSDTSNLDFGGGPLAAAPSTFYAAKLTPDGTYLWAKTWGDDSSSATMSAMATGPAGEIVFTGSYQTGSQQHPLDFGGGPLPFDPSNVVAAYLVKLTSAGDLVFSLGTGAYPSLASNTAVAVNAAGDVYWAGGFGGTIDLGSGPVTSAGGVYPDVFVAKFDPVGAVLRLDTYGDGSSQFAEALALDGSGVPTIGGIYVGSIDFGNGPLPTQTGNNGGFIARLAP